MVDSGAGGRTVLLSGGTSEAGAVAARKLADAGARVIVAGRSEAKLAPFADEGLATAACDLTDEDAVRRLAVDVGPVDGILHLVGGWRGGGGIEGQSDEDFRFLANSLTSLRFVTREFWPGLVASDAARIAMVSSTSVARPIAGSANYTAVKAASEAWMRALAHGFTKAARDAGHEPRGAATIFRVKVLAGLEDRLATEFTGVWDADAASVNDRVIEFTPPDPAT